MSRYLIWSNQHGKWWGPNGSGYTRWIEDAGCYDAADASRIVSGATVDGQLKHAVRSEIDGSMMTVVDEVMVPAPKLGSDREHEGDEGDVHELHPAAPCVPYDGWSVPRVGRRP